jgi:hypothetical protein
MASNFFRKVFPDYEGTTPQRPGFEVNVVEQDGGVGLSLDPQPGLNAEGVGRAQVFMTTEQAHELVQALIEAIDRAETKQTQAKPAH